MICLTDNDIIKKLAICDLLDESLAVLDTGHVDTFVLPSARFVLGIAKDPDKARARLGAAVFDRLADFLGKVQVIHQAPYAQEQRLFDDVVGIDAGEAVLFSATAAFTDFPADDGVTCEEIGTMIRSAAGHFDKAKVYRLPIDDVNVADAVKRAKARGCAPGDLPEAPATAVHAIIADLFAKKIISIPVD